MENDRKKTEKKQNSIVYMELGNNSIVHTQQMHRHTVLETVYIVVCIIPFLFLARSLSLSL